MTEKQSRPRLATGSGGKGESAGASFDSHYTLTFAKGNPRQCYTSWIERAERRLESECNPERRAKLARLIRYLTHRLADCIVREVGR